MDYITKRFVITGREGWTGAPLTISCNAVIVDSDGAWSGSVLGDEDGLFIAHVGSSRIPAPDGWKETLQPIPWTADDAEIESLIDWDEPPIPAPRQR